MCYLIINYFLLYFVLYYYWNILLIFLKSCEWVGYSIFVFLVRILKRVLENVCYWKRSVGSPRIVNWCHVHLPLGDRISHHCHCNIIVFFQPSFSIKTFLLEMPGFLIQPWKLGRMLRSQGQSSSPCEQVARTRSLHIVMFSGKTEDASQSLWGGSSIVTWVRLGHLSPFCT